MITQLIPSFNAGELSPLIHLRSDLEKYRSGCRTLRNMLITPYGGVRRRPGLEFIGSTKDNGRARLIPFQYSTEVRYVIELGAGYMRFWDSTGEPATTAGEIVVAPLPDDDPRTFLVDFYRNESGTLYRCVVEHIETTFAADLALGYWVEWDGPLEFFTPYQEEDLREVQRLQINAVMYFTHPSYPPRKLRWESPGASYFREVEWTYPALLEENLLEDMTLTTDFALNASAAAWATATLYEIGDRVTYSSKTWKTSKRHTSATGKEPGVGTYQAAAIGPSGSAEIVVKQLWTEAFADESSTPGQEIDITSAGKVFTADHVGAYFEISKQRAVNSYEVSLRAIDANDGLRSDVVVIQGGWQFDSFGDWDGTFYLERSKDRGATWEDIRSWESDSDRNVTSSGEEPLRVLMRIRWEMDASKPGGKQRGVLSAVDGYIRGVARILTVTDEYTATAESITPVEKCTTEYWAEGAWSNYQGYPRTVAGHEQRVVYGGTARRSQTVWGSAIDDYENFQRGVEDDDSYAHSLAADQQNAIQWLLSQKQLLIGTGGGEWVMASSKEETPITPTNVRARRHSGHGSEFLTATLVNEATLFVQRGGRKLREMVFSFEADGYVTQDLTVLAEHVTAGGILETAFQQQRDAILWCVTGDGKLIGVTYERGQKVVGWHVHETGILDGAEHLFESAAVLSTPGEEDELWVVVNRGGSRYIERLSPDQFDAQIDADFSALNFLDSSVRATAVSDLFPINSIDGLDHLEGLSVEVVADGNVLARRTVTGGEITLDPTLGDPATALTILVGLPSRWILEPMALEVGMQNGTSASRTKRTHELAIYFHQSGGCEVGSTLTGSFDVLTMREVGTPLGDPTPLFTGLKTHQLDARHDPLASFVIRGSTPLPASILAVVPKWNIYGDDD